MPMLPVQPRGSATSGTRWALPRWSRGPDRRRPGRAQSASGAPGQRPQGGRMDSKFA